MGSKICKKTAKDWLIKKGWKVNQPCTITFKLTPLGDGVTYFEPIKTISVLEAVNYQMKRDLTND